jgi:hypothetical protein
MKKFTTWLIAVLSLCLGVAPAAPDAPKRTVKSIWRPCTDHPDQAVVQNGGHFVHFQKLDKIRTMKSGERPFQPACSKCLKAVSLPIDWTKNHSIQFPMDLNDTYGDCYMAAGCHADNCWAGNSGQPFTFSLAAIQSRYFTLSGGDNGLADADMQDEMMSPAIAPGQGYLADGKSDPNRTLAVQQPACIVDWMQFDPTDATATQTAMQRYGACIVTFGVPDNWLQNSNTGAVWDVPATADPNNGHAVIWTGCRAQDGAYCLQTWGTYVWVTPAAAKAVGFTGWIAFSPRWFDPHTGYAPNGVHISDLAAQWVADGGRQIDSKLIAAFPPKTPTPTPGPSPTPTPTPGNPVTITLTTDQIQSVVTQSGAVAVTGDMTINELIAALQAALKAQQKAKPAEAPKKSSRAPEPSRIQAQVEMPAPTVTVYSLPAPTVSYYRTAPHR